MNQQTPAISIPSKPPASPLGSPRRAKAFTLIEILVVIGIILVLIGLFFVGGKVITGQAKERDTRTTLDICKTLFENYRTATHLTRPPPAGSGGTMAITTANISANGPGNSITTSRFWTVGQEVAPGTLSNDPNDYNTPMKVSAMPQALINTALVMYALKSLPENAAILNNIPAGKTLNVSIALLSTGRGVSNIFTVPLLLDGWGNPILFVPGGGLGLATASVVAPALPPTGVVWMDTTTYGIVTSAGVVTNVSTATPPLVSYDAANPPSGTMMTNQPFFVSAGPDGSFNNFVNSTNAATNTQTQSDDNIYSFK